MLVGADVALSSKSALMGHALGLILEAQGTCRQTLKVLLHLVGGPTLVCFGRSFYSLLILLCTVRWMSGVGVDFLSRFFLNKSPSGTIIKWI